MVLIYLKQITNNIMKQILTPIIVCFVAIAAMAQTDMMRISYAHHAKVYKDKSKERIDKYIFHTDFKNSTYYNPSAYFLDKSAHDENARNAYGQMASAMQASGQAGMVPSRTVSTYVFKTFDNQSLRVYQDSNEEYIYYDEPFDEMKWELVGDSTKTVLNYECMMAETDYHGRHWTVWFTPEIPVQDGPWKFEGLPGMILMASDSTGDHSIVVTGIEYTTEPLPKMEVPEYYSKGNRIDFLKLSSKSLERSINEIMAMHPGAKVIFTVSGAGELSGDEITNYVSSFDPNFRGLETDY